MTLTIVALRANMTTSIKEEAAKLQVPRSATGCREGP
jgi:hypothetical protein